MYLENLESETLEMENKIHKDRKIVLKKLLWQIRDNPALLLNFSFFVFENNSRTKQNLNVV